MIRSPWLLLALAALIPEPSAPQRSSATQFRSSSSPRPLSRSPYQALSPSDDQPLIASEDQPLSPSAPHHTRRRRRPTASQSPGSSAPQPLSPSVSDFLAPLAPQPLHPDSAELMGPGQGGWHITYWTVEAEGDGCDVDWLEVEVGEVQDTKLVVNQQPKSDCSAGSEQCLYTLFWKCADLDDEEEKPKKQDMAVRIDRAGKLAAGVASEVAYRSFDGKMTITEEKYAFSDDTLSGTQTWSWVSEDGSHKCKGEDRIKGRRAHSMACDTDLDDEGWDAEKQQDTFGESRSETLRRKAKEPKRGDDNFYTEHVDLPYLEGEHEVTDEYGNPIGDAMGTVAVTIAVVLALLAVGSKLTGGFRKVSRTFARFRDSEAVVPGEEHLRLPLRA